MALRIPSHNSHKRGAHQVLGMLIKVCGEGIRERGPPNLLVPSSTRFQQPQSLWEFWGWGFPDPLWSTSSLSLSPAPSPGLQFTPDPRRCPEFRSPHAPSGAFGTHARTWRARTGSSRAGSGEWNPRGGQATARPAWKLCSVNLKPAGEEHALPRRPLGKLSL